MRDYIGYEIQNASKLIEDLGQQERVVGEARGPENRSRRDEAERRAKGIRETLLTGVQPDAAYEYLEVTGKGNAISFRTLWQEKNFGVDCLADLVRNWKEGREYYQGLFASPHIDLRIFPTFSFVIQFTFTLAQSYISRDEQKNFYIIDNPVRKDKIFGLPYVAPSSWKGSLRSALWQLGKREKDEDIRRLFGNEKGIEDQEDSRSGRLHFFPTFFTRKGLEIINPQDRKLRVGSNPIPFESVPRDSEGSFTVLYVPFDRIGEDEKETRREVAAELRLVAEGLQAMFRIYGFGAKTSSGFGLAKEKIQGTLSLRTEYQQEKFASFVNLVKSAEKFGTS
jgi:CRISPR-associated protein Cmr2